MTTRSGLTVIIINPIAGSRPSERRLAQRIALAERAVRDAGGEPHVQVTAGPGHATALAREAVERGAGLVIAWGGDGTVNEVACAVAFSPAALGIVPAGSGDGLARELGIAAHPARALAGALGGAERTLDAGEIDGRLFFNVAGVGVDAWIAHRFNRRSAEARRGLITYAGLVLKAIQHYEPRAFTIEADGHAVPADRAYLLTIANAPQFGNGVRVAPSARFDDGRLDLVTLRASSSASALWRARGLFGGGLRSGPGVKHRTVTNLRIEADAPIEFHVDGEAAIGGEALLARVHPGALHVRC